MKVYDWKMLVLSILVFCGLIAWQVKKLVQGGDFADLAWLIFYLYLLIQSLRYSLTKYGYEQYHRRAARLKRIYRKKFGRWASVVPWLPLLPFLAAAVLALIFRSTVRWIGPVILVLMFLSLICTLCLRQWVNQELDRPEEPQEPTEE